jgi:hypothetical protein
MSTKHYTKFHCPRGHSNSFMSSTPQKTAGAKVAPAVTDFNPYAKRNTPGLNHGTIAIEESRAVAEVMGKLFVASRRPRDKAQAFTELMEECARPAMAEEAEYSYPRGTETVSGPSIRLAEAMARVWGNIEYGIRELSDDEEGTEMEAYCWDLETNVLSSQKFRVKKERSTRQGSYKLTDQRDVYEQNANLGSRRLRARILAVLPADLKEHALAACKRTLAPKVDELPARVSKMVTSFGKMKVTPGQLEKYIGRKTTEFTADDFTKLIGVHNSLKDGFTKPGDWFEGHESGSTPATDGAAGDLNKLIAGQE